jgi:hypothetical protein
LILLSRLPKNLFIPRYPLLHLFLLLWTGIKILAWLISVMLSRFWVGYKISNIFSHTSSILYLSDEDIAKSEGAGWNSEA